MEGQLKAYEKTNPKFKCYFSVDKSITDGWSGFVGFVNEEKIRKTLGDNGEDTIFLSCGPPILSNIVEKIWSQMKFPSDRFYRF